MEDAGRKIAALLFTIGGIFENANATDWLQFGYDAAHSGFNRAERGDAYDTVSGAAPVSDSSTWATTLFNDTHWQSPIVVNGRVYAVDGVSPTAESQLWVYELDGVFNGKFD